MYVMLLYLFLAAVCYVKLFLPQWTGNFPTSSEALLLLCCPTPILVLERRADVQQVQVTALRCLTVSEGVRARIP